MHSQGYNTMLKDATFKEKFTILKSWMPSIVEDIKKDLKNDHLQNDRAFTKAYFAGKPVNKLSVQELSQGYSQALESDASEQIGEFICNRWLLKNTELYNYFENELRQISENFSELTEIDKEKSLNITEKAIEQFGAPKTYLFAVLNSVVFPKEVFEQLNKRAQQAEVHNQAQAQQAAQQLSSEELQKSYEEKIARLTDKYEKKLQGLQKKYITDTETLKKQIVNLHKKLDNR